MKHKKKLKLYEDEKTNYMQEVAPLYDPLVGPLAGPARGSSTDSSTAEDAFADLEESYSLLEREVLAFIESVKPVLAPRAAASVGEPDNPDTTKCLAVQRLQTLRQRVSNLIDEVSRAADDLRL